MDLLSGFRYAADQLLAASFVVLRVIAVVTAIEYIFNAPIFIKRLRMEKEARLVGAGPGGYSFLFFVFCFVRLVVDAYVEGNAPADFYYIQWWLLMYPLAVGLKKLLLRIEWKGDD